MDRLTVRPMTEGDIPAAVRLEALCFSRPWSAAAFRSAFAGGLTLFLAAQTAGETVGYAGMQCVLDEGFVTNIAVDPAFRRRGAGRALLAGLLEAGRERGLSTLSLEVWPSNAPAAALYESAGFRLAGRRKNFYSRPAEDALILTYPYQL